MNSKNKNILLVICLFVILVIFLDLIFNFSSIVIENFQASTTSTKTIQSDLCDDGVIKTQSIISQNTGKIFNISFYGTGNACPPSDGEYIINIYSPRTESRNLAVNNDGTISEVKINSSDPSQQFIIEEINNVEDYETNLKKNLEENDSNLNNLIYPFYVITPKIPGKKNWRLAYEHGNLFIFKRGPYPNQRWDISNELIRPFYTNNMDSTSFGQLRSNSDKDKEQLDSQDKIKINFNLNDELKQKLFGLEEESGVYGSGSGSGSGSGNSNQCPTYLPNKSIESLCNGCDVDKL